MSYFNRFYRIMLNDDNDDTFQNVSECFCISAPLRAARAACADSTSKHAPIPCCGLRGLPRSERLRSNSAWHGATVTLTCQFNGQTAANCCGKVLGQKTSAQPPWNSHWCPTSRDLLRRACANVQPASCGLGCRDISGFRGLDL